mmetsp:Transcript_34386/g.94775  ORF Transcript_34386/g.94775 Transcript_34386/m.94775 type:complete len:202 (+) Transcript_34386:195-800(+)
MSSCWSRRSASGAETRWRHRGRQARFCRRTWVCSSPSWRLGGRRSFSSQRPATHSTWRCRLNDGRSKWMDRRTFCSWTGVASAHQTEARGSSGGCWRARAGALCRCRTTSGMHWVAQRGSSGICVKRLSRCPRRVRRRRLHRQRHRCRREGDGGRRNQSEDHVLFSVELVAEAGEDPTSVRLSLCSSGTSCAGSERNSAAA